jgi:sporulenol synthase
MGWIFYISFSVPCSTIPKIISNQRSYPFLAANKIMRHISGGGKYMDLLLEVKNTIAHYINRLANSQQSDGSWKFCFESGPLTDSFMIMTLRSLEINEETLIRQLSERLLSLQTKDGYWKIYDDEKGNLSATIQAYNALLFSGLYSRHDENLKKAERFIVENGGLDNAHFMTKWMLSSNGQYPWPRHLFIPMTFLLIPSYFPLNFFDLSVAARIHLLPMAIVFNKRFSIRSKHTPDLSHLLSRNSYYKYEDERFFKLFANEWRKLWNMPKYLHTLSYKKAEQYMLERIEADGTLLSYASATFFMIYALLALGYQKNSPVIDNAIKGLKSLVCETNGLFHLENSTSTIWDTALLSYSLQQAGVKPEHRIIKKSTRFLLKKQHTKYGDWSVHNPNTIPGGWGFSNINTINPDIDDTTAALRAITPHAITSPVYRHAWNRGVNWLLSMQNSDGGWASFEKNTDHPLFSYIPLENAEFAAIDSSTADLTGRALEFLGNFAGLTIQHPAVKRAVNWLIAHQEKDGSWHGKWGVCYIYGTWAAITGLMAVKFPSTHPAILKAINWLKSIQRKDGGWGESCRSCEVKKYVPLAFSTPSQTAWAIDALIASGQAANLETKRGIQFLLNPDHWMENARAYPTGVGLPGQFYIYYHSYNEIFPLLALSHYRRAVQKLGMQ